MWKTSTDPFAIVGAGLSRRAFNGPAMGARWSAVAFVDDDFDGEAFAAALAEAVEEVERQMSRHRRESDLERLNRAPLGVWLSLVVLGPVAVIVGFETVGHRHQERRLAELLD